MNFIPHAATHITNTGGIEIMLNESNDGVFYRYSFGGSEPEEINEAEIEYFYEDTDGEVFEEGRPGFETNQNYRFYLDEMIKY